MLGAKLYEYEQALPSWVQIPNNSRTLSNQRLVSCYMPAMYFLLNIENFEMVEWFILLLESWRTILHVSNKGKIRLEIADAYI